MLENKIKSNFKFFGEERMKFCKYKWFSKKFFYRDIIALLLFGFNDVKHGLERVTFAFECVDNFAEISVWSISIGSVGVVHGVY